MNIVAASKVTLKYAENEIEEGYNDSEFKSSALQVPHQIKLLNRIIDREVEGEKAHRWLGWAQCALAANEIGDLNVFRAINYACGLQE